jgi:hypothetical protein
MIKTRIASCALDWWRASGKRTIPRLFELVEFFAQSNGEMETVEYHKQSALANLRQWEIEQ